MFQGLITRVMLKLNMLILYLILIKTLINFLNDSDNTNVYNKDA